MNHNQSNTFRPAWKTTYLGPGWNIAPNFSHRISLSCHQTDGDIASAEKISLSSRRATDRCELSPREEGWVDPSVLSCWYFVKNDLGHSGRTGITSIAVRGLALVPKDQTLVK